VWFQTIALLVIWVASLYAWQSLSIDCSAIHGSLEIACVVTNQPHGIEANKIKADRIVIRYDDLI
jgi:hypothetical protein